MSNNLNKLQKCLLAMTKDFHVVCGQHNLEYYMLGGTLLGAIRHQGFIPWDDDVDIGMPRQSYERFLDLPDSVLPPYFSRLNKGYGKDKGGLLYTKLCNKNTTLVEVKNETRVLGIHLDIFPLDGAGNNSLSLRMCYLRAKFFKYLLWLNASEQPRHNPLKLTAERIAKLFNNRWIHARANLGLSKVDFDSSMYAGNFLGNWGIKEILQRSDWGRPTLQPFEDTFLYAPEKPEKFLRRVYGDYMTLPPLEKQISHHAFSYIDYSLPFADYEPQDH